MGELNKMLKERGIAKELSVRLKQRRRTLKNRNYASSCREKKDEEILTLEKLKGDEIDEVSKMEEENVRIKDEIKAMEEKYNIIIQLTRCILIVYSLMFMYYVRYTESMQT